RSYAANERGEHSGRLLLATTHTQARYVLPPAIAGVRREYPQVDVDLQAASDAEVLQLLKDGADLALISTAGGTPEGGLAVPPYGWRRVLLAPASHPLARLQRAPTLAELASPPPSSYAPSTRPGSPMRRACPPARAGGLAVPLYGWRRVLLVPASHPLAGLQRAPTLAELATHPLISYESSTRPDSSMRRAFASVGVEPQLAMTARDANLIKTYVRAGLGAGLLAGMAVGPREDQDLRILPAPAGIPECITWAVIPRGRVLREYALTLLHRVAPQLDRRDLRRVLEGNMEANWPKPPGWQELSQSISL